MENIIYTRDIPEMYTDEACFISELLNSSSYPNISIAKARVQPGVTTQLHVLTDTTEFYYILSGTGESEINGVKKGSISTGDIVIIPSGISQRIKNTGHDDLIFLCICLPRFEVKNYQAS